MIIVLWTFIVLCVSFILFCNFTITWYQKQAARFKAGLQLDYQKKPWYVRVTDLWL